jgi:diguanylate cyclase (GGDEF)-like protein/PAS domain S-box-containing protein
MKSLVRILLLEDNVGDAELVHAMLETAGICLEVVRVEHRDEFAGALEKENFDIIISDFSLPSYDGRSGLALTRLKRPDIPFIFFSGTLGEELAIEALKAGAADYVLKDRPSRLVSVVLRSLREAEDRAERTCMAEALQAAQERFKGIYECSKDAIIYTSLDGRLQDVNEAMVKLIGYHKDELLGKAYHELTVEQPVGQEYLSTQTLTCSRGSIEYEKELICKNGQTVPVVETVSLVKSSDDKAIGLAIILKDMTERKRVEQEILELAYHDPLTGLPNRRLFADRLELALSQAFRNRHNVAVLLLDLDGFKAVNDTLGHGKGDQLLQGVAKRLKDSVRTGDTVARLGGDEFSILLPELAKPEDAVKIAHKVLDAFGPSFVLDEGFRITVSIGMSLFPADGSEANGLVRNADAAMYRAKQQGGNTYQLCTPAIKARTTERLDLECSLRYALERQEFRVYYQPLVDLRTWQIVGMEALMRWVHPTLSLISPSEFIAVAEESGLIVPLSLWVLQTACAQTSVWHRKGYPHLRVAVNLSDRQLWREEFVAQVVKVLQETGMEPNLLELEITERMALQNTEFIISVLTTLSKLGIHLSMDDFGTGHGSLSCLRQIPVNALKIDQSFVRGIGRNSDDDAIVRTLISLGHSLRLNVIAECVETEEQLRFLQAHRCDFLQGFLFSPAVDADAFERLLETNRPRANHRLHVL